MEVKEEYHDPDYPGAAPPAPVEPRVYTEEEKIEKIKSIIRREFSNELETRESEALLIEQRMSTSRHMLHRLRYAIVNAYYNEQKLQLSNSQIEDDVAAQHDLKAKAEVSSLLRDGQRRLHPSVRKLLGKQDLGDVFKTRTPRIKARKDYSAMLQTRNYTIAADATTSLRPERAEPEPPPEPGSSRARAPPRRKEIDTTNVLAIDEATRNNMKRRYRLIVGNTSKYAPPASRADRSTHKWLLYVRAPEGGGAGGAGAILTKLVARLHHSYAPHHTVTVTKPPFHVSRRGWGEFPAQLELHFRLPAVNRPATLEHVIKLDRNYTGMQTLGSETIVEVWLYSTPEMLPFEYHDPVCPGLGPADANDANDADVKRPLAINDAGVEHAFDANDAAVEQAFDVNVAIVKQEESDVATNHVEMEEYDSHDQSESWMEFFRKDSTELDVDEMIIKPVKKEPIEEKSDVECQNETASENEREDEVTDWAIDKQDMDIDEDKPATPMKRIMKYIDSTTGKIYYLEMDRTLDLTKVQEIVINNTKAKISPIKSNGLKSFRKRKGGVSLLKPEVKNQLLDSKEKQVIKNEFSHIENDHCYLGNIWRSSAEKNVYDVKVKAELSHYSALCSVLCRLRTVKMAVNYLLKKIPVVSDCARDPDYLKYFPFSVESEERYWKLEFAKRRNIEWTRANLIRRMIMDHTKLTDSVWRTKQILIYSRLHGFHPMRQETAQKTQETNEWSSWNDLENSRKIESNVREIYPNASDISSLTLFDSEQFLNGSLENVEETDSDEEVEVVSSEPVVKVKTEVTPKVIIPDLEVMPVESEDDRLRFLFIEKMCGDIGIELWNEDVGNGYSYSAVHAVLLSAFKSFAEELIRGAAAHTHSRSFDGHPPVWTSWRLGPLRAAALHGAARRGPAGRGALAAHSHHTTAL